MVEIDKHKLITAILVTLGAAISALPAAIGTDGVQTHDVIASLWTGFLAGRAYWVGIMTPTPRPEGVERRADSEVK